MDEFIKTFDVRRSVKDFRPFHPSCERAEKKWFTSLHSCIGESDPFSGTGHRSIHRKSSFWRVKLFTRKQDDGGGKVGVDSTSVRGPPSPGLRARTMDVAQDLMALRGSSHAYNFDCRLCFGRLIGDHDDRFEGFCWSKTLWRHRKG